MGISSPEGIKRLYGAVMDDVWFKNFVESYRCKICKKALNLDNFGGLGPNHGIFCKDCYDTDERINIGKAFIERNYPKRVPSE